MKKRYIAIDVGGTTAKYAVVSECGQLSRKEEFKTGADSNLTDFCKSLKKTIHDLYDSSIEGIGICSPGFINSESGMINGGIENLPYLDGVSLPQIINEWYPEVPVAVMNDLKAIAMGELWMGAGRSTRSFACLAFGTGLGGAIVIDGNVLNGCHYRAGEVGYLDYQGEDNFFEKRVSTINLVQTAGNTIGEEIDGPAFFEKIRQKNEVCIKMFEQWIMDVARCIANIIILLDVEKIIIGGGVSAQGDNIIIPLKKTVNSMLPTSCRNQCEIVTARCGNNAGMLGTVYQLMKMNNQGEIIKQCTKMS